MIATSYYTGFRLRRCLRFRLRTLFILMTLVAAGVVWTKLTCERLRKQEEAVAWIEKQNGYITYDFAVDKLGQPRPNGAPPGPRWVRKFFGPQWGVDVVGIQGTPVPRNQRPRTTNFVARLNFDDNELKIIETFPKLKWLFLYGQHAISNVGLAHLGKLKQLEGLRLEAIPIDGFPSISDAGLAHLAKLPKLSQVDFTGCALDGSGLRHLPLGQIRYLNLTRTQVTDANLVWIAQMEQLEALGLAETKITDKGLAQLQGLAQLFALDLRGTAVTDEGLAHLTSLKALQKLSLSRTAVTEEAAARLSAQLPKCKVSRSGFMVWIDAFRLTGQSN
jgi:hypothetical protein